MRNIFLLYMPPGNAEAMVHYQDTIRNKVWFDRIAPHVSSTIGRRLQQVFGQRPIAVWGSRDTDANRSKFDRMAEGDEILIIEGQNNKNSRRSQTIMPHWPEQNATPLTRMWCGLNLLLHVMHHGHSSNQNDSCDYLVRVKAGVEKTPCDAHGGQRLHHLEVTCC